MKKYIFIFCFSFLLFSASSAVSADTRFPVDSGFPVHLGGFTIGDNISNYQDLINLKSHRKITFNEYLGEGEVLVQQGFKSGLVAYGLCDRPNEIVRIKLKFTDSSKRFFNKLLKKYKARLGEPDEYKGDPFQTMIAWKWSFINRDKERISLILQNNQMVEDEKIGTAVKLTLTSQLDKERACFMEKRPENKKRHKRNQMSKKDMWKIFVPY